MLAIFSTIIFCGVLLLGFFLPGFVWWRALFGRGCSIWEELVLALAGSLAIIDILMLILDRIGLPLAASTLAGSLLGLTLLGAAIAWIRSQSTNQPHVSSGLHFSLRGRYIFFSLCALTIFIRTLYLAPNILPTATDLGHHIYWADSIKHTESLPTYQKIEVVTDPTTGASTIAVPRKIADFIIGEHLPLAFFSSVSGLSFFSAFPILFLHLINLLSVIAVMVLAYRLAEPFRENLKPELIALCVFFVLGPLFALASPQEKFVTGGVVGNIFGNFFIPVILLLFYRGLNEKQAPLLTAGFFFSFILAYTHHLSTLVLAGILLGILGVTGLALWRTKPGFLRDWFQLAYSPSLLIFLFLAALFMLLIALPTYLDTTAIDSALGTPTKTTRTGLSFFQISMTIGAAKVALGIFGLLIALITLRRQPIASGFLLAWGGMLLIMTMFPHALFLDIPSNRIGSYLSYPLGLTAGFALAWTLSTLSQKVVLPPVLTIIILTSLVSFLIGSGSVENANSLTFKDRSQELVQTFAASEYLAQHSNGEMILKDHNYLSADAWIKIFFKRDYGYPLSRGLFGRYEEGGNRRERCTLAMISTPNTDAGERCFHETAVRYLLVNPIYDSAQFEKSDSFSKLYTSETAAIYEKH